MTLWDKIVAVFTWAIILVVAHGIFDIIGHVGIRIP